VTLSSHERKEMKLAVMLMIVVLVFLICNVLPFIVNIMELFSLSFKPLTEISNLLVTINSSVNIFIYTIFGDKFQRQLVRYLRRICPCILAGKYACNQSEFTKSEYNHHYVQANVGGAGGGGAGGGARGIGNTSFQNHSASPSPFLRVLDHDKKLSTTTTMPNCAPAAVAAESQSLLPAPADMTSNSSSGSVQKVRVETHVERRLSRNCL
jgi:hypothetical protein